MFNMFLMERSTADAYCTFLFGVLEEVMRRAHLEEKDAFAARMPGRISEFLLDVWIDTNEICCIEIPLTSTEPVNWFKKEALFSKPSFSRKIFLFLLAGLPMAGVQSLRIFVCSIRANRIHPQAGMAYAIRYFKRGRSSETYRTVGFIPDRFCLK